MTDANHKVWDFFIRFFHWTLVVAFIISYLSEGEYNVHFYSGWYIAILLTLRVMWGFIGTKHARFVDFIKPPSEIVSYAKSLFQRDEKPKSYLGHNPLGGIMVIALLSSISMTAVSGVMLYTAEGQAPFAFFGQSPTLEVDEEHDNHENSEDENDHEEHEKYEDGDHDEDGEHADDDEQAWAGATTSAESTTGRHEEESEAEEFWEELHEFFANLSLLLILIHIAGVIISGRKQGVNLVKAMITGKK